MATRTASGRRAPAKARPKAKPKPRAGARKGAFGGYAISFAGRRETAEQIFGKKPVPPSEMTKKLWAFVKSKKLANK